MIIECSFCEARIDCEELKIYQDFDESNTPYKIFFLKCPQCENLLLGESEYLRGGPDDEEWSELERLWPDQETGLSREIPMIAKNSLIEAKKCYKAKAYKACAAMSGSALEGVCRHCLKKNRMMLGTGLKALKEKGIIDKKFYKWGEELQKHRNISAHATLEEITEEDAKDLLDFAQAICEYVFVLTTKFDRFMERKVKK